MPIPGKSKNCRQIKRYKRELYYNGGPIDSHKSYKWSVERCHIQWSWAIDNKVFKVMPFFDAETAKDTAIVTMEGE